MSRTRYFARRILLAIPVLFFATSLVFVIIRTGPLDPLSAIVGQNANPSYIRDVAINIGIRQPGCQGSMDACRVPLWQQYIDFMSKLLTLDFYGQASQCTAPDGPLCSWVVSRQTPVGELIAATAPRTIWLGFWSVLIALLIGIPLGFYAGLNPNTFPDYIASFGGIVWRAMPNFWLGIILLGILGVSGPFGTFWVTLGEGIGISPGVLISLDLSFMKLGVLLSDPGQFTADLLGATKRILPAALVLGSASMGNEMRIGRTAVLETINSDYVETARAKGLPQRSIVWKHVFRNALIPLVPIITSEAFLLIGGSVIVEQIFRINGLGSIFFKAILGADMPLAGTIVFIFIVLLLTVNILQDFLYTIIDPRIGYE
jgi:peptide/nickel transport system permease protein